MSVCQSCKNVKDCNYLFPKSPPPCATNTGGTQPTDKQHTEPKICPDYCESAWCVWQPTYMKCGVVPCKREAGKLRASR